MSYHHRIGEKHGIGNHDAVAIRRLNYGGAGLNVLHLTLKTGDGNPIAQLKGFLPQQQNSRQEILQDILERRRSPGPTGPAAIPDFGESAAAG